MRVAPSQGTPPGFKVTATCGHAGDGRSPDLRVIAFPNLPELLAQWFCRGRSPLTVAGAVTDLTRIARRTVFPFHPLGDSPSGTIIRTVSHPVGPVK